MNEPLRILSIGAHPADVFDNCAGTLAHHTSRGDSVACVVLTHGARIHDEVISDSMFHREEVPDEAELSALMAERSDVKVNEIRAACKILGVEELYFFGADDAILLVTEEAVRRLARLLRELRPDIVLTQFPKEGDGFANQHAVAGQITMHAIQFASSVDPGDRNPPHSVAQVFYYASNPTGARVGLWGAQGGYSCDVIVDITDVIEKKLAALDCLVSQYPPALTRKFIEVVSGNFGNLTGRAYAEGFTSLRATIDHHLPITDEMLAHARSSDRENADRRGYRLPVD